MGNCVVLVSETEIEREVSINLELVLEISLEESSPISHHTLSLKIGC
jgi:hypothetical protein